MAERIRGALFDKDGTLIDFTATWGGVMRGMLDDYSGGDADAARALGRAVGYDTGTGLFVAGSPVVAGTNDEVAAILAPLTPGMTADQIEDDANRRAEAAATSGGLAPVDGLAEALARLRAMGLSLGVATNDGEASARSHLAALGVADDFVSVAGYDSGWGMKPAPGMCLGFASVTGRAPATLAMVGDSPHDLAAGRAAGYGLTVGVLTGPATEAELAPLADVVLPSVADLPDFLERRA